MSEEISSLAELLFHAERFCNLVQTAIADAAPLQKEDDDELRLKMGQCSNTLVRLQHAFDEDQLHLSNAAVRMDFRFLSINLLWVAFYARKAIDFRIFRTLVMIHASLTLLLNGRVGLISTDSNECPND
jgi:hypothetical protein